MNQKFSSSFLKHDTRAIKWKFMNSAVKTFTLGSPCLWLAICWNTWVSLNFYFSWLLLGFQKHSLAWQDTGWLQDWTESLTKVSFSLVPNALSTYSSPQLPLCHSKSLTCTEDLPHTRHGLSAVNRPSDSRVPALTVHLAAEPGLEPRCHHLLLPSHISWPSKSGFLIYKMGVRTVLP